jgi:hypothetical protein
MSLVSNDYTDDFNRSGYAGPIPPVTEKRVLGQFDEYGQFHRVVDNISELLGDERHAGVFDDLREQSVTNWAPDGETRIVDASGGAKGSKLARFDMIPPDVLWELAEHYGKGEAKYPSDPETGQPNWQLGYSWRLSVAALQRHLFAWLAGEDTDPETGSSHLIAVIWHCIALRWFQLHDKGKDYR